MACPQLWASVVLWCPPCCSTTLATPRSSGSCAGLVYWDGSSLCCSSLMQQVGLSNPSASDQMICLSMSVALPLSLLMQVQLTDLGMSHQTSCAAVFSALSQGTAGTHVRDRAAQHCLTNCAGISYCKFWVCTRVSGAHESGTLRCRPFWL